MSSIFYIVQRMLFILTVVAFGLGVLAMPPRSAKAEEFIPIIPIIISPIIILVCPLHNAGCNTKICEPWKTCFFVNALGRCDCL